MARDPVVRGAASPSYRMGAMNLGLVVSTLGRAERLERLLRSSPHRWSGRRIVLVAQGRVDEVERLVGRFRDDAFRIDVTTSRAVRRAAERRRRGTAARRAAPALPQRHDVVPRAASMRSAPRPPACSPEPSPWSMSTAPSSSCRRHATRPLERSERHRDGPAHAPLALSMSSAGSIPTSARARPRRGRPARRPTCCSDCSSVAPTSPRPSAGCRRMSRSEASPIRSGLSSAERRRKLRAAVAGWDGSWCGIRTRGGGVSRSCSAGSPSACATGPRLRDRRRVVGLPRTSRGMVGRTLGGPRDGGDAVTRRRAAAHAARGAQLITLLGGVSLAVIPAATVSISSRLFTVDEQGFLAVAVLVATFAGQLTFAVVVESRLSSAATERRVVFPLWLAAISVVTALVLAIIAPERRGPRRSAFPSSSRPSRSGGGSRSPSDSTGARSGVRCSSASARSWACSPASRTRTGRWSRSSPASSRRPCVRCLPVTHRASRPEPPSWAGSSPHRDHGRRLPPAQRDDPRVPRPGRRGAVHVDLDGVRPARDPAQLHAPAPAQGALDARHRRLGRRRAGRGGGAARRRGARRVRVPLRRGLVGVGDPPAAPRGVRVAGGVARDDHPVRRAPPSRRGAAAHRAARDRLRAHLRARPRRPLAQSLVAVFLGCSSPSSSRRWCTNGRGGGAWPVRPRRPRPPSSGW